jgi:hypothetical protein
VTPAGQCVRDQAIVRWFGGQHAAAAVPPTVADCLYMLHRHYIEQQRCSRTSSRNAPETRARATFGRLTVGRDDDRRAPGTKPLEDSSMCMNCGCGEVDTRHKETDIVQQDIQRAAEGQGMSQEETIRNLEASMQQMRSQAGSTSGMGASSR